MLIDEVRWCIKPLQHGSVLDTDLLPAKHPLTKTDQRAVLIMNKQTRFVGMVKSCFPQKNGRAPPHNPNQGDLPKNFPHPIKIRKTADRTT